MRKQWKFIHLKLAGFKSHFSYRNRNRSNYTDRCLLKGIYLFNKTNFHRNRETDREREKEMKRKIPSTRFFDSNSEKSKEKSTMQYNIL